MKGFVDKIDGRVVRGWCICDVEIVIDRRFVLDPERYFVRSDLADSGVDGRGFEIDLVAALPRHTPVEIIVRPRGHLHPLTGGYLRLGPLKPFQYVGSDVQARTHNERLMQGAVRGVCLFTARAGGTMLTDLIRAHPRAYGFAEPIEGFVRGGRAAFAEWLEDYFILPSFIEYPHEVPDPALMFMTTKINRHDTDLFPMFNRYGVKYLRLYRENVLKQAVSYLVARRLFSKNRNFNLQRNEDGEFKERREKIFVDPEMLLAKVERYQKAEQIVDDMIATYAEGAVMSISYEQLVSGEIGLRKVLEYFDLEWVPVSSRHVKVNSDDLSEVIDNFDEVVDVVRRTRFAHFCE